jgi:Uma2 family endonuclease
MVQPLSSTYAFDPADPRAPTMEQWDRMSLADRAHVRDLLPSEGTFDFLPPPEGDAHWEATKSTRVTLREHFRRTGKKIYISSNLAVYYPGQRLFSPDILAVLDVETRERLSWIVADEGKGLDFVLEIHVAGNRSKDEKANVVRYAQLGIREYFFFDRKRLKLSGHRLPSAKSTAYERLVPQAGRFTSEVLGLDLMLEGSQVRFFAGAAALEDVDETIQRLGTLVDKSLAAQEELERALEEAGRQLDEERRLLDEERRLLDEERRRREEAERARREADGALAEALAEIERLKGR